MAIKAAVRFMLSLARVGQNDDATSQESDRTVMLSCENRGRGLIPIIHTGVVSGPARSYVRNYDQLPSNPIDQAVPTGRRLCALMQERLIYRHFCNVA
jgi:hypothetical protein